MTEDHYHLAHPSSIIATGDGTVWSNSLTPYSPWHDTSLIWSYTVAFMALCVGFAIVSVTIKVCRAFWKIQAQNTEEEQEKT